MDDKWHMGSNPMNTGNVSKHLARAIDFVVSARYLHDVLVTSGSDGESSTRLCHIEQIIDQDQFIERMAADWGEKQYSPQQPDASG